MKTVLMFLVIVGVAALLTISTPAHIIGFVGACALLGAIVARRKRQFRAD